MTCGKQATTDKDKTAQLVVVRRSVSKGRPSPLRPDAARYALGNGDRPTA